MTHTTTGESTDQGAALERVIREQAVATAFQPIVDIREGGPVAFEALTRVESSSGFAHPGELFDAAERFDRVWALECVTRRAALNAASKLPAGALLFMNSTPQVFADERFADTLKAEIEAIDYLTPCRVVVEITERSDQRLIVGLRETSERLQEMGFQTAIDDVGAGASGLNRITNLSPNWLKLDRELIDGVDRDPIRLNMVRFILNFARLSGVSLIAEGIERAEELATLADLDVPFGQGYLLGKPIRSDQGFDGTAAYDVEAVLHLTQRMRFRDPRSASVLEASRPLIVVEADTSICEVAELLEADPSRVGAVVRSGGRIAGWCEASQVARLVASGREADAIGACGVCVPTVLESSTTVLEAIQIAASRPEHQSASPFVLTEGANCVGVVTSRGLLHLAAKAFESVQRRTAPVTGLPGRVPSEERLAALVEEAKRHPDTPPDMAAAFIDIRGMARFNAAYGFELGDHVIRALAGVILGVLEHDRLTDAFVGHLGDDRFLVVASADALEESAPRVIEGFTQELDTWLVPRSRRANLRLEPSVDVEGSEKPLGVRVIGLRDIFCWVSRAQDVFAAAEAARAGVRGDSRPDLIVWHGAAGTRRLAA